MMSTLRRCTRRMWFFVENGKAIRLNSSTRCAAMSTTNINRQLARKTVIEDGLNGEKIFKSPYTGTVTYPTLPLHEYVWENVGIWSDKVALKCGMTGRQYTYAEARDASNWVARSLLDMGFKPGDVIALVLPNLPETPIAFLGSIEAGLIVTTVNPNYTADEITRQLINSGARGVVTNGEILSTVLKAAQDALPEKSPLIVIDDGTGSPIPSGSIPFKELISRGKTLPEVPPRSWNPDDIAVLPYSSGTTGLSKGVMLTHRNLISNIMQADLTVDGETWQATSESYQEIIPAVLPFFHIYGMNGQMLPNLRIGTQMITLPKFTPKSFLDVFVNNKATGLFLVPPIILFMIADSTMTRKHLDTVNFMISGAAPIGTTDVQRFYEKFGIEDTKLKFLQGYGLTESSPVTFVRIANNKKYASIGSPVVDSEARLVDPITKRDVASPGETGELWVRGSHVMKGYFKNQEATKETLLPDGWLRTGDLAYFDEDHDFFITDRLKELIKVKGFQVPPAELEALLRTHPDIAEAGVIGVPDDRCGELPRAFVVTKKNRTLNEKDVQDFVKGKVTEYKELKGGVSFIDAIPKNSTGKILRRVLKTQYSK